MCAREADAAARLLRAGGSAPRQLIAQLGVDTKMYQVATRLDQIYTYTRISQDPATADRHTRVAALAVCEANGDPTLTPAELVELEKSAAPIDVVALRQLDLPD